MRFHTSLLFALATTIYASPVAYRQEKSPFVFTNHNGLNFTQMNTTLPNVTIFATGGTIAGSSSSSTATTGYTSGALGILTLINAVPEILNVSNVAGVQIANVDSPDITSTILLKIAKQINTVVCNDPTISGAVVTHGTDTLEETAFFLDTTLTCAKPVIIVGAMRPATAISADGPFNLLEAVTVAITPSAKDRGAMVVMNDRIVSAYYVTKTNANTMDTFKAPEQGNLGSLISNTPYFYYPPVTPTGRVAYDIQNVTAVPRVDILMSYQDMSNDTLYNAVASGAKGIVIAGSGAGSMSISFRTAAEDVVTTHGIPIVDSTRSVSGEVPHLGWDEKQPGLVGSGYLNPYKSRVLLGVLLALGRNMTEIAGAFGGSGTLV